MTRIALDSNLLLHVELESAVATGRCADKLILKGAWDVVVPVQVLGEFLRVDCAVRICMAVAEADVASFFRSAT